MQLTPIQKLLSWFFFHLYHRLAWSYDLIAVLVSGGHWNDWVRSVTSLLPGHRILELGFGPGHLQLHLARSGFFTVGVDESPQMARQADRRLHKSAQPSHLTRGLVHALPFPTGWFDGVVSTFPADAVFSPRTLQDVQRVLKPGGSLIILPSAMPGGRRPTVMLARLLLSLTGQGPHSLPSPGNSILQTLADAGFHVTWQRVAVNQDTVLIIQAVKHG